MPHHFAAQLGRWPALKDKPKRKLFEPTDAELARLLAQPLPENLRRWLLNSMATLGRPMAVAQLCPAQRDRPHGLISLNPEGRRQNKKFRPTVKEPKVMTRWLNDWERGVGGVLMQADQPYSGYTSRSSIHTVLRRACGVDKANLPRMALYSLRHRVRRSYEPQGCVKRSSTTSLATSSRALVRPRTTASTNPII
jgi:hypothetical protein